MRSQERSMKTNDDEGCPRPDTIKLKSRDQLSLTPKVPNLAGFAAITQGRHLEDTKVTKFCTQMV